MGPIARSSLRSFALRSLRSLGGTDSRHNYRLALRSLRALVYTDPRRDYRLTLRSLRSLARTRDAR